LISTFGSLQNAINAQPEQISAVPGWGEKKVQQWCHAVREDFRVESTKRASAPAIQRRAQLPGVNVEDIHDQNMEEEDEEEAVLREVLAESRKTAAAQAVQAAPPTEPQVGGQQTEEMSEGIAAAIARLRDNAG
jgi:DNA excision repair protein ERCC-1